MSIYKEKVEQFTQTVDVDFIMITEPMNVYYFTGVLIRPHERMLALLINVKTNETALVYPALDEGMVGGATNLTKKFPISDGEDAFQPIFEFSNGETIGVEGDVLSFNRYKRLREKFEDKNIVAIDGKISNARGIKTTDEKQLLLDAVDITEKALADLTSRDVVGMTEAEIASYLVERMKAYGGVGPSFGPIVLTGANSALPHGVPGDTKVEVGDFLLIDFGVVTKDNYVSDITRTFIVGEPTDKQREIYEAVLAANVAGVEATGKDVVISSIDAEGRKEIDTRGYGEYFTHRIGHGLGLDIHEAPSMDQNNQGKLVSGNVVTIEPGIYIEGYGGVRIEDMLFVDDETVSLTQYPKTIEDAILR
ncbi:MAG TPA: aminopeptidase P family protein [Aliicoccus persicus]|uniref:Aminopeptidase P family protein n=1 Tax=Aliicoccus persicus TaxID=930138 RepID=A0A921B534_9STAP|nr:aminopeptidase P family protein [Aliicoccus persicus]